jgi:peptidoglycan/xylan/chitin deacetylase (PgdA/CDA1 family)
VGAAGPARATSAATGYGPHLTVQATPRAFSNRTQAAVFLCYHSIALRGPGFLSVAPELLERQLHLLRSRGYRSGTAETLRAIKNGERLTARHVFLTFDDGYRDTFTTALPLLKAYGFTGTVFVLPPYLDEGARFDWPGLSDEARSDHPEVMRSMDWTMVGALVEAGWEVGSHTLRHPALPRLGDAELHEELVDSRRRISERMGKCDLVAYPFGMWSLRVAEATRAAGYSFGYSLPYSRPLQASSMAIPRIPIDYRDVGRRFAMKLQPNARRLYFMSRSIRTPRGRLRLRLKDRSG